MLEIIFSFVMAFFLTYVALPVVIKIAIQQSLVDIANERKSHVGTIPSFGGVGIFLSVFLVTMIWTPETYFEQLRYILTSLVIVFLVGAKDDIDPIAPHSKLLGQLVSISILIFLADIRISQLYGLLGITELPYWLSIILSTFFYIFIINSFNLIDGINGLSSSIAILVCLLFGVWFYNTDHFAFSMLSFAVAGSTLAFLKYNITPAKIFMGDTGSLVLGTICAVLTIKFLECNAYLSHGPFKLTSAPAIALAIVIIPAFDTIRVFILRILKGQSPFNPDKNHIHHLLLDTGLSHMQSTSILLVTNIGFIILAFELEKYDTLLVMMALICIAYILSQVLNALVYNRRRSLASSSSR